MAFRKTLAHRFLHVAKTCGSHLRSNQTRRPPPEPDIPRRLGPALLDRIRVLNPDRIRLDCLLPPNPNPNPNPITALEVRKVLRAAQMEMARSRLRDTEKSHVSYEEFLRICCQGSNTEQGSSIAKSLDESGSVIVFGDRVFLRPDQIAKAIESAIPLSMPPQHSYGHKEELREMEEKKAEIDREAEAGVKRELWAGLGFLVVQTVGFMRLTFWELSWDVMEPICFYVTSIYFMAGYGFFLRTSREPSFEGFFQSRFAAKQRRLMKAYDFDLGRFNQLKRSARIASASDSIPLKEIAAGENCSSASRTKRHFPGSCLVGMSHS